MFEERALVRAAQQGDLDAFNQLILHYQAMAYSVVFRIVQNQDDAADIVQASLLNAFHKLDQLQGSSFKSWLMRIVINRAYDLLRARKRRVVVSWENSFEQGEESASELIDESESPLAFAERSELNEAINKGLSSLKEEYRTVLVLADVEGYNYEEIAEIMQWPIGTVKSSLSRGRAKLRDYLLRRSDLLPKGYAESTNSKNDWNTTQGLTVLKMAPSAV